MQNVSVGCEASSVRGAVPMCHSQSGPVSEVDSVTGFPPVLSLEVLIERK